MLAKKNICGTKEGKINNNETKQREEINYSGVNKNIYEPNGG